MVIELFCILTVITVSIMVVIPVMVLQDITIGGNQAKDMEDLSVLFLYSTRNLQLPQNKSWFFFF